MNGLQQFILGCLLVVVIAGTVAFIIRRGLGGRVSLSLASIFDIEIEIEPADADAARAAARSATEARGDIPAEKVGQEIENLTNVRLARVLWVDDDPDGNLYETIALEELGLFVTKATSTAAGAVYLGSTLHYSLIISDITRQDDPDAGAELLALARDEASGVPVIFYTFGNESKHAELLAAGASAVVQTPDDLIRAVLAHRPG
ncbi:MULTISPECIES: response regulator [unclassified Actinomadura]|uniref:response regulator n=1 Tax=unclassified Actinomadura TaxID=2626254 RepID=UPI00135AAB18|nr:response regulator [Actinomadura sp. K4S16]